jgi:membrane-associated protease RseP (regulator of RpoE activity)
MSQSLPAVPSFVERRPYRQRYLARPTAREWFRHSILFLLTILSTTFAGLMLVSKGVAGEPPVPASAFGYLTYIPLLYFFEVRSIIAEAIGNREMLGQGLEFSAALLAILTSHEAGHYIACRRYGVDATLPFFIPAPPLMLAGTFGAFIKIRSPLPSRNAVFDVGVAGPIAGFVVAVPILIAGLLTAQPAAPIDSSAVGTQVYFHDSLLAHIVAYAGGIDLTAITLNPLYFAAWLGLLVTSLNLMPVGQLDGGHATYAVFGARVHAWIGKMAFACVAVLTVLGWFWHNSPSGFLYTLLLVIALRLRHPEANDERQPLDSKRKLVAALTLLIFFLCFLPFPLTIK